MTVTEGNDLIDIDALLMRVAQLNRASNLTKSVSQNITKNVAKFAAKTIRILKFRYHP